MRSLQNDVYSISFQMLGGTHIILLNKIQQYVSIFHLNHFNLPSTLSHEVPSPPHTPHTSAILLLPTTPSHPTFCNEERRKGKLHYLFQFKQKIFCFFARGWSSNKIWTFLMHLYNLFFFHFYYFLTSKKNINQLHHWLQHQDPTQSLSPIFREAIF